MTTDPAAGGNSRAADVLRFWRRAAPKFNLPAGDSIQATCLSESRLNLVYRVTDETAPGFQAVVRWPRGSLLRVDPRAGEAARLTIIAGESGLAPRVLMWDQGALELDGQPVVVTEAVADQPPPAAWFPDNLRQAATLLARLHRDEDLTDILEKFERGDPRSDCLAAARAAWADVQWRVDSLGGSPLPPAAVNVLPELETYTRWFGAQIQPHRAAFQSKRVGPAHGDVNRSNWLVDAANRVFLVDWDRAHFDDPALDVGMLLHWYVPTALWSVFAREYAVGGHVRPDPEALLARARIRYPLHAIDVCLWRLERLAEDGAADKADAADEADALAFLGPFLADLRRLRAGTFGA